MARFLDVYLYKTLIGELIQNDDGKIEFVYSSTWLNDPNSIPLSHSLPLQNAAFNEQACRGYFAGILPEGKNREIIARNVGVSAHNDFALLEKMGGECAGAVTFLPKGVTLEKKDRYRTVSEEELADKLKELPIGTSL